MYVIIVCGKCKRLSIGQTSQKSRRCPYCGTRISLLGTRIVARAASAEDARIILSREKERLYRSRKKDSDSQFRIDYADPKTIT